VLAPDGACVRKVPISQADVSAPHAESATNEYSVRGTTGPMRTECEKTSPASVGVAQSRTPPVPYLTADVAGRSVVHVISTLVIDTSSVPTPPMIGGPVGPMFSVEKLACGDRANSPSPSTERTRKW